MLLPDPIARRLYEATLGYTLSVIVDSRVALLLDHSCMASTPRPSSSFAALHVALLWVAGQTVWAQQLVQWKTVSAIDPAVTWAPGKPCLVPCGTNWYRFDHYIVSQAPSPNHVALQFNGTAIEVYGGTAFKKGQGTVTMDDQPEQTITFLPALNLKSQKLASYSGLNPKSPHTLVISFANSSRTLLGFDYFRVQESPDTPPTLNSMQSQHPVSQSHSRAQSTKGPKPTTESTPGRRIHLITNTPSYSPGNPSPGDGIPIARY